MGIELMGDTARTSTSFGRVDADGTVYVRTDTGERVVGSWQAGSAEEGLAHFARRYDDLATEVNLLASRLASGAGDPQQTKATAQRLRESLPEAAVVGDLTALAKRLDSVLEQAEAAIQQAKAEKAAQRDQAIGYKTELIEQAEKLAESTQWKVGGEKFHAIIDVWKTIRGIDRKTDNELWQRFLAARNTFNTRRREHFAELDTERKKSQEHKERLVAQAEELADSTEWQRTSNRLKQLMSSWKTVGRASKQTEERLWKRFREAQDRFFAQRAEALAERDAELKDNQRKKEELLGEAEKIALADPKAAQHQLRELQQRWDEIGHVPREMMGSLERKLHAIEDRIRQAGQTQWRRVTTSENPLLTQMREQVAKASRQLERAKADGDTAKIASAEKALAAKQRVLELAERSA